jgi:hypothetical protein
MGHALYELLISGRVLAHAYRLFMDHRLNTDPGPIFGGSEGLANVVAVGGVLDDAICALLDVRPGNSAYPLIYFTDDGLGLITGFIFSTN